ncbi:MAG: hypothetical protein AABX75_02945 [Nanoarchaeota archaeon]
MKNARFIPRAKARSFSAFFIIWSDDKKLKKQNEVAVLNTAEIIQLFGRLDGEA